MNKTQERIHILKYAKSGDFFVLKFGTYKESKF